jgi:hypothetical protein
VMALSADTQALARKWGRAPYPKTRRVAHGGCTCQRSTGESHVYDLGVDSACGYHAAAAQNPDDHRIPWNCPTYWDGCNCPDMERIVRNAISVQRRRRGHATRADRGIRRPWNPWL